MIVYQGNDCPSKRFFTQIPVGHMGEFMIGNVRGFRHRGERQVEAMCQEGCKERHIYARITCSWSLSLIEVGEKTPESDPIIHLNQDIRQACMRHHTQQGFSERLDW